MIVSLFSSSLLRSESAAIEGGADDAKQRWIFLRLSTFQRAGEDKIEGTLLAEAVRPCASPPLAIITPLVAIAIASVVMRCDIKWRQVVESAFSWGCLSYCSILLSK